MLKTSRAYFCQTVAEGSPLSRITSNLFNQARQSVEALFRRPGPANEILSKQPGLKQFGGRVSNGGVVAQLHANSRELLTKFAQRNQTSELVNAMRQRFGWTGAFRSGMWGQKFSTFAFVGIGVAAGAQWNVFDERNLQDPFPDMMALFGKGIKHSTKQKIHLDEPRLQNPEPSTLAVDFELDMPLRLDEEESLEQSYIVLSNLTFDDEDVVIPDDQSIAEVNPEIYRDAVNDYVIPHPETSVDPIDDIRNEQEEQYLLERLKTSLQRVETQRAQLFSLSTSVSQLSELLHDLTGTSTAEERVIFEETESVLLEIEPLLETEGFELRDSLIIVLSVAGSQQLQLNGLKQQLLLLNQQLHDITAAASRPVVVRSSFSKRDACCGPGVIEM